jgi:hypothetical protein
MRGCGKFKLLQGGWLWAASHEVACVHWLIETCMHSLLRIQAVHMADLFNLPWRGSLFIYIACHQTIIPSYHTSIGATDGTLLPDP